jgi:tetratricopeptide (TPR) repeat protein
VLADLLMLSPELSIDYPDVELNPKLDPESEQRRLFENIVRFCDILCQDVPLMVVLEDMHWADSGSLRMLEHLARRTRQQPVMLLGTYREVELDEALPLHETLLELTSRRLGRRVKLERLDREKTRDLLAVIFAEEITPDFLEMIYRETEGNPFFVEEVSKSLVESGQVWYEGGEWQRVPHMEDVSIPQGVKVAIQSRVSKLTDDTQGILLTGAVIGREFDYQTLAIVSGKDEDTLIDSLEEGISKQLIEEMRIKGEERFSFSHALISATLRESISGLRRTRLHRQVATAIEELHPEDYERLAYHWGEAGDEERGLEYTIKAADRARVAYANEDAVRLYSEVLMLLPDNDPARFELLGGRAAAYDVMAERESQLADVEEMLSLAEGQSDEIKQVDALLGLANLYLKTETTKAQEPLEKALKITGELGDVGREGRTLYSFGMQAYIFGDLYKAREYFESSTKCLNQAGQKSEMAESLSFLSVVLGKLGDRPAALQAAQEAIDLSKETGDKLLEAQSTRRLALGYIRQYQDSQALPIAETALQMFHELGDLTNEVHGLNVLGIIKGRLGMVEAAESDFLEGLKIAESIGNEVGIRWLISNLSFIYNWNLGNYTKTMALIEDQEEKARLLENESADIILQSHKVDELIRLGRYKRALSLCETILPYFTELDEVNQGWILRQMGELFAELGMFEQAFRYLDQARELCSRIQNPSERAYLDFITARIRLIEGEISNFLIGMENIKGVISFMREGAGKDELGNALYTKTQLHLALWGEDHSHAESALECTEEALNCYGLEPSTWVMPEQIHFQHSRALRVNGREEEADEYLRQAYERVMMVAGNISDEDLRRSYLENVRDNRAIQAAYQERFG